MNPKLKDKLTSYFFILPSLVIFTLLTIYPMMETVRLSFYRYYYIRQRVWFVGFKNYVWLLKNDLFLRAIFNTLEFDFMATSLQFLIGLLLALIFNVEFKLRKVFLPFVILPMLLPPVAVCSVWKLMLDYRFGIINDVMDYVGLPRLNWLGDPNLAMLSIVIVDTWQYTPFVFLVLLAGLQSIPRELYEAAMIDGAGKFDRFKNVTLPLLKPFIMVVILLRVIDTFKIFTKPALITGGGPGDATETLTLYFYKEAFKFFKLGIGSAAAVIMTVIVGVVSLVYLLKVKM
ncbi:MAG: sugar ABC transporter permease [Thermofilum sp. ex4484_15]|nr:MAG: sugar ABC transporter permease [Thermofilum sp. ex4484_15]